uniref:YadA family autotransporter adhesin n=1 Tax=Lonepinella sp. BR2474 TaxID=3434548 RepID=UPI003F6E0976
VQNFTTSVNGQAVETVDQSNRDIGFVNGMATTARMTDNKDITFDVNVDDTTIKVEGEQLVAVTTDLTTNNGKTDIPTGNDAKALTTAEDVAHAINDAYHNINVAQDSEQTVAGGSVQQINAGDSVNYVAGKNLVANISTETDGVTNVTYGLAENISVKHANVTESLKLGDEKNKTILTSTEKGLDVGGDKITNVSSNLNLQTVATNPDADSSTASAPTELVNLTETTVNPNSAATVGDLQNMGWVVSAEDGYRDVVKNANEVNFTGSGVANVTGSTDTAGVRTINVEVKREDLVGDITNALDTVTKDGKVESSSHNFLTGEQIAGAINSAYFTVSATESEGIVESQGAKNVTAGTALTFDAGRGVAITQDENDPGKFSFKVLDATLELPEGVIGEDGNDLDGTVRIKRETEGTPEEIEAKNKANENLTVTAGNVVEMINGAYHKVNVANSDQQVTATAGSTKVKAGTTMNYVAGKNLVANIDTATNTITYGLDENIDVKQVKAEQIQAEQVSAGNITINNGGRISGVASGINDKDAVNVSQLKGTEQRLGSRINRVGKESRAGLAGSNAAAALPQVYTAGKSMVAASTGTFKGQGAVAVGYSRASDSGKVILKFQGNANTQGDVGAGIGMGYQW